MQFDISSETDDPASVLSIQKSLDAIVAIDDIHRLVFTNTTMGFAGNATNLDAYQVELSRAVPDLLGTDPLEMMRSSILLAISALMQGRVAAAPLGVELTILRNCPDAACRNVGAFWNGAVIHLHPLLSGEGTLARLRQRIDALRKVKCWPTLLPDLPPNTTWDELLRLDCVVGAGTRVFTGTLDGYSISKTTLLLRVDRKLITINALAAEIAQVIEQAQGGKVVDVTVTINREVLLPKPTYQFRSSVVAAVQADLAL